MHRINRVRRWVRALFQRASIERDVDHEMRLHLALEEEANLRAGMGREEARRAALVSFGGMERFQEQARDERGGRILHDLVRDLRLAVRTLGRSPGFVLVAVFTLAVGIGANTAIFSVLHTVLFKPLPFDRPDTLVTIRHTADLEVFHHQSPANYYTYREEGRVFEGVGMWAMDSGTVTGVGTSGPEEVPLLGMTDGVLPVLGVNPMLGRRFTAEDDSPKSPLRVMLTYGYWQRAFGGDRGVIGRQMVLDGRPCTVIGVLGRTFRFLDTEPALIVPLQIDRPTVTIGDFGFSAVARLKPRVTIEQANRDVGRMIPLVVERFPLPNGLSREQYDRDFRMGPDVRPLTSDVVGDVGSILWVLLGTVGIVLLIACANVASLFLVRAEGRQHELAVRAALGAGRFRIVRELLTESLVLGVAGGALGLLLAYGGIRLLVALAPAGLPRLDEIAINPVVLAFTLGLALLSGLLFGVVPAFRFSTLRLGALGDGGRAASDGRVRNRTRGLLVVSEVALALVLLVGSGLMVRTFQALRSVDAGFTNPEEVLTFRVAIPRAAVRPIEQAIRTHEQIVRRIEQVPGVRSVGLSTSLTMDGRGETQPAIVELPDNQPPQRGPVRTK